MISSFHQQVFHTEFHLGNRLIEEWGDTLSKRAMSCQAAFYIWLSYDRKTLILISNSADKDHKVEIKNGGEGNFNLILNDFIRERMFTYSDQHPYLIFTNLRK